MKNTKAVLLFCLLFFSLGCEEQQGVSSETTSVAITNPTNKIRTAATLNWEKLNPARGDKSPQAADIWGDRKSDSPTGFLVKFVDGFSSPPHIHNVTYRAVVINGLVHNDDPAAEKMWMPPGSFWTQPAGESHITAAKGNENVAYVEIDSGPYLVKPLEEVFDNGERPINIDLSNMVWLTANTASFIRESEGNGAELAFLWGSPSDNKPYGTMIKLPAGFKGEINSNGSIFNAIIVQGQINYQMPDETAFTALMPGSLFTSQGSSIHQVTTETESLIYLRTNDSFEITLTNKDK